MIHKTGETRLSSVRAIAHLMTDADRSARIMVVDDDVSNLALMQQILRRAGFENVCSLNAASNVLDTVRAFKPDAVLLDLHMPGADGVELIAAIAELAGPRSFLPVLVLTGDSSTEARDAALAAGAKDFLIKPYEATEVVLRVRNLIETRLLHVELQRQNEKLSEGFAARTAELDEAKLELLERLARASDFRDETTHAHTQRVGELSARIARQIGLPSQEAEHLRVAARLHDIGKIGVSDAILQKNGPLTPDEFEEQERHTIIGANILSGSRFPLLRTAEAVALTHHEAWDGSGYPRGLNGEQIPLSGRIVAVADVFDALTHARPYKAPWSSEDAMREIAAQSGRKFDPKVVEAFLQIMNASASNHAGDKAQLAVSDPNPDGPRLVRDVLRSGTLG